MRVRSPCYVVGLNWETRFNSFQRSRSFNSAIASVTHDSSLFHIAIDHDDGILSNRDSEALLSCIGRGAESPKQKILAVFFLPKNIFPNFSGACVSSEGERITKKFFGA
jgi:hypothetical protein